MSLTDGIISAWRMVEASGNLADFVGPNTLVATGMGYHATGKINYCIEGDGVASAASIAHASQTGLTVPLGEDRTFAFWLKTSVEDANPALEYSMVGKRSALDVDGDYYFFDIYQGYFYGGFNDGTHVAFYNSQPGAGEKLNTGNWILVVVTFTRTAGGLNIYRNNTLLTNGSKDASAVGAIVVPSAPFRLMRSGYAANNFLPGDIDELIIWNRVLSSGERAALYNAGAGVDLFFAPTVSSITPARCTRGNVNVLLTFAGAYLTGCTAIKLTLASNPDLTLSAVTVVSAASVTAKLTTAATAALGLYTAVLTINGTDYTFADLFTLDPKGGGMLMGG